MPVIRSQVDTRSEEFAANQTHMRQVVDELERQLTQAAGGGSERARERHTSRGKLLPRERIEALLDPGSPFLELSGRAAHGR